MDECTPYNTVHTYIHRIGASRLLGTIPWQMRARVNELRHSCGALIDRLQDERSCDMFERLSRRHAGPVNMDSILQYWFVPFSADSMRRRRPSVIKDERRCHHTPCQGTRDYGQVRHLANDGAKDGRTRGRA